MRYNAIRPIRDAAARIAGMRLGEEEPGNDPRLLFLPPNAQEATIVAIPEGGQKPQDYQHWRTGCLSADSNNYSTFFNSELSEKWRAREDQTDINYAIEIIL